MFSIGIDLGGTNIAAGVVDEKMNLVRKESVPTRLPRDAADIVKDMGELALKLTADAALTPADIAWVGVGAPGTANRDTGVIEYSNNLRFDHVPLKEMLEKLTGRPAFIENDANAAAYGEYLAGAAKGARSAAVITLGTGVGGGIIVDGHMLNGCNFAGGEPGHHVIRRGGRLCTCGRHGCWEAYASASGLIQSTVEVMEKDRGTAMWKIANGDIKNVNGKTAFDAMRMGDAAGTKVVDEYIADLACGLVNVINIFQPDVLCIGGGICREGENLLRPLRETIERERYSKYSSVQTRLVTAQLGNDAGIIGAAMLGTLN